MLIKNKIHEKKTNSTEAHIFTQAENTPCPVFVHGFVWIEINWQEKLEGIVFRDLFEGCFFNLILVYSATYFTSELSSYKFT